MTEIEISSFLQNFHRRVHNEMTFPFHLILGCPIQVDHNIMLLQDTKKSQTEVQILTYSTCNNHFIPHPHVLGMSIINSEYLVKIYNFTNYSETCL